MKNILNSLLKELDGKNQLVTQLNNQISLVEIQIENKKNLVKNIYMLCNLEYDDMANLVSVASINGGEFIDYNDSRKSYKFCVRFDYEYSGLLIRTYIYDTEAYLITDRSYKHTEIDNNNPSHHLAYLVFNKLLNGNAFNYIKLPEELFPIYDPEYNGSLLEKIK